MRILSSLALAGILAGVSGCITDSVNMPEAKNEAGDLSAFSSFMRLHQPGDLIGVIAEARVEKVEMISYCYGGKTERTPLCGDNPICGHPVNIRTQVTLKPERIISVNQGAALNEKALLPETLQTSFSTIDFPYKAGDVVKVAYEPKQEMRSENKKLITPVVLHDKVILIR